MITQFGKTSNPCRYPTSGSGVSLADIYNRLQKHYDAVKTGNPPVYTDAQIAAWKAIARGIKDEMEKFSPSGRLKAINAAEGKLLDAGPYLRRATGRIDNKNIYSLDDLFVGAISTIATKSALGPIAGMAWRHTVGSPTVQSKSAIMLDKLRNWARPPGTNPPYTPPAMLNEPAWQTGMQGQLPRRLATLEEMYPQGLLGEGTPRLGLPEPTQIQLGDNVSWSQLAENIQSPPKPYATLVPKPIGKYKAPNPNLIFDVTSSGSRPLNMEDQDW